MAEKELELASFKVLGEDEFRLAIQIGPTNDENYPSPENVTESIKKGEVLYNAYWAQ